MRALVALLFGAGLIAPLSATAQEVVPDRYLSIARDVDLPGNDLRPLFDTTLEACSAACRADPDCVAFTFNSRNDSCFPKSAAGDSEDYSGAFSGVFRPTDAGVLARLEDRIGQLSFLRESDFELAREQALDMARAHYGGAFPASDWRDVSQREEADGNLVGAMRLMGAGITRGDLAADWTDYARLLLAIETEDRGRQREYRRAALRAATNAALRAAPGEDLARAATILAQSLEEQGRGRDAIPALRLAIAEAPTPAREEALDRVLGLYGFRVTDTRVEAEAEFPRICAIFSEPLAPGGVLFDDFLQTTEDGLAVEAEDRQFCITGVSHGSRYEFTLRADLPAASGEVLRAPVTLRQYVRDRQPSVRFAGRAYILPASAGGTIPLVAVNTDLVDLRLYHVSDRNILRTLQTQYFGRPLADWELTRFAEEIGEEIWQGEAEVAMEQNRSVTTRLPIGEVLDGREPGLYALEASVGGAGTRSDSATQWFLVSDLGVTTLLGADGVHVIVRSLETAGPRAGVSVSLVSASNRLLGEVTTDADGYAHFDAGLARGEAGAAPAMVSLRDGESDFAFLSLREAEFDLSDRGVEGREPAGAIDLFLTTERGAYRAGETIHATALARDGRAGAVTDLPLTAILNRADGVEYARQLIEEVGGGGYVFDFDLGADVPRGTWRLSVHADPDDAPLSSTSLLVEDFLPERIDVALGMDEGPFTPGDRPRLSVQADYLFGAPASDLEVTGRAALRPTRRTEDFPGHLFGRHDDQPNAEFPTLSTTTTGDDGSAALRVPIPALSGAPQPSRLTVTAQVAEASGRPVERSLTRVVLPDTAMIGIRPLFDSTLPEEAEAEFDLIAVGADALPVRWVLNRVERRYQWYRQNGNWTWEPITTRSRIATGETTLGDTPERLALPVDWGSYELRVESDASGYAVTSVGFDAGWYGAEGATDTPDVLEVSLDAESYSAGDTATLRIVPRQGGVALVQVMSNRLIDMQIVELGDDPTEVTLPVTEDWGAGAYVTASLIRPIGAVSGPVPTRAMGLVHAAVDPGARALDVTLETPEEARPRQPLEVALRVDGAVEGETVHATIAAVDLGILNLTGFDSPDPQGHYFGQRRLGMEIRDVYGRLIDSRDGAEGRIRQGGDAGAGMRMQAPPPTQKLVAEFSGPLTVGADGLARASFDMPAFNGTVRLMAVAWSETGVGQAEAEVILRDPVVVQASLPRFLAPGDSARMLLELAHAEGATGEMQLAIETDGGVRIGEVPGAVTLGEGETQRVSLPIEATGATGVQEIRVALTTPDGIELMQELMLPVQVNDPEVAETSRVTLSPGQSFLLDAAAFTGFREGVGRVTVAAGPLARFDAAGLLTMLDRYPYGCTEQVTSGALPLLYLSSVAEALDLGTAENLGLRIADAIGRVLTNQSANGGFGLWRAGSGDLWLDAYVTDFLSRARAQGHRVPAQAFQSALDNLANQVAAHPDFEEGGQGLAYALMVLAREGQASMGDLRYYADVKADSFATPLALGQLGAALAMYGDQPRADAMFRAGYALLQDLEREGEGQVWRADYGSDRRDAAGLLALAAAAGSEAVPFPALSESLATVNRPVSTQEAVWSLLAAHALIDDPSAGGLRIDGEVVNGPLVEVMQAGDAARTLENAGDRDEVLTITRFGVPEGATEAFGNGFRISRSYLTLEGQPVDPAQVAQGTRMVAVLTVTPTSGTREGRLIVNDPLPAGFEIDNPNLLQSGDLAAVQGLDLFLGTEMAEFRQDRFLAAVDRRGDAGQFRLAYIVRAVTPGDFHHPAASVEDMYRPQYRAQTASGRVVIASE
ncbi:alpha-2-macroglobulin family protein [Maritalea mobilis]|uniref:alpha-2-macroglobulin family protein n=1 Tax=Maritalea mobilis TaxID=483324 RepID=UPI001C9534B8|nr:alpha-2-macroglobulin family protein [Maritalea mobilis]MBY6201499.1 alpha-2-macroglobulin family protein [Maritalea mobilis]